MGDQQNAIYHKHLTCLPMLSVLRVGSHAYFAPFVKLCR